MRTIDRQIGRKILRGVLCGIFGGRRCSCPALKEKLAIESQMSTLPFSVYGLQRSFFK
jgi:hypothetical protein